MRLGSDMVSINNHIHARHVPEMAHSAENSARHDGTMPEGEGFFSAASSIAAFLPIMRPVPSGSGCESRMDFILQASK